MSGLRSSAERFMIIHQKVGGAPFRGSIQPADEGVQSAMLNAKLVLRTLPNAGVAARDIVLDPAGQRYLVGKLSTRADWHTFRLFEINADVVWKRTTRGKDPLTGLPRNTVTENLGTIPAMIERSGSDRADGAIGVMEETRSIVTGADLKPGDVVDDAVVQWAIRTLGVTHGEIR